MHLVASVCLSVLIMPTGVVTGGVLQVSTHADHLQGWIKGGVLLVPIHADGLLAASTLNQRANAGIC